jgi:hypothetical protein
VILARRALIASTTASASASGTMARRIAVHFWPAGHLGDDALDEEVELGIVHRHVGAEDRAVQRVGLDAEADAAVQHGRVLAQDRGGVRRAGERDGVLLAELVQQRARAAADQLQAALGQDAGGDDLPDHRLGDVRRLAAGLDDAGQAREERGRELLEHAPDGEVEGVDLDRDAGPRGVDVLADEGAGATEPFRRPVEHDGVVGQLTGALARVGEERPDAAVDVDHRVPLRAPGAGRQRVELPAVVRKAVVEVLGELLEQAGALVEGQGPHGRTADGAGVLDHRCQVEAPARDPRDLLAGRGVEQRLALVVGAEPAPRGVALQHLAHVSPSPRRSRRARHQVGTGPLPGRRSVCNAITDRSVSKYL